jgi:hypothetical protein
VRKFLRFIIANVLIATIVFLANVVINPYGVWPSFGMALFSLKTQRINSVRLVKAYDLFRSCPDHLITGMSTVVWGIDPKLYPDPDHVLYNGGIVGSSMIEQYDYVMRYLKLCPNVTKVYLDINSESFNSYRINAPDFVEARLQNEAILPQDIGFTSFSKSAVVASYMTGQTHLSGIVKQMVYDVGDGFHHLIETDDASIYSGNFRNFLKTVALLDTHNANVQIAHLRALIEELRNRNIEVVAYFGPIHLFLQYQFTVGGYGHSTSRWEMYEDLKRKVSEITDFYDFNEYNPFISESIDRSKMFIDQIHYRPRLGKLVLEALNGHRENVPDGFGQLVTNKTIDEHLQRQRDGIKRWVAENPQYTVEINKAYAAAPSVSIPELRLNW